MPNAPKILIIGGGISGLACAWRLRQLGLPVLLLERGSRFGGVIDTVEQDGFRFDIGPQSFTNTPALSELIDELGLTGELLRADPRAPRYILHARRPRARASQPAAALDHSADERSHQAAHSRRALSSLVPSRRGRIHSRIRAPKIRSGPAREPGRPVCLRSLGRRSGKAEPAPPHFPPCVYSRSNTAASFAGS